MLLVSVGNSTNALPVNTPPAPPLCGGVGKNDTITEGQGFPLTPWPFNFSGDKMRKYVAIFCFILLFYTSSADAFIPLAWPAAYILGGSAAILTGVVGTRAIMKSDVNSTITASGLISRPSKIAYFLAQGAYINLMEKDVSASLSMYQAKNIADKNPSEYPALKNALKDSFEPPNINGKVGDIFIIPEGQRKVSGVFPQPASKKNSPSNPYIFIGSSVVSYYYYNEIADKWPAADGFYYYSGATNIDFPRNTVDNTPPPLTTPAKFASRLSLVPEPILTDVPVTSSYQAEIDKMLQDSDYVPEFSDDTTGLPLVYPPDIVTPAELDKYNNETKAREAAASVAPAQAAAVSSGQASVTAAQAAATSATTIASANPSDSGLQQKAAEALAALAAAQATLDKTLADIASAQATETAAVAETAATVPEIPARKTVSFAPLLALNGILSTTYPFNLPNVITSYFSMFQGEGLAPAFDLPLPMGNSIHVDLAIFDPVATLIRFMLGILITCGMFFYIIHFFRGVS